MKKLRQTDWFVERCSRKIKFGLNVFWKTIRTVWVHILVTAVKRLLSMTLDRLKIENKVFRKSKFISMVERFGFLLIQTRAVFTQKQINNLLYPLHKFSKHFKDPTAYLDFQLLCISIDEWHFFKLTKCYFRVC